MRSRLALRPLALAGLLASATALLAPASGGQSVDPAVVGERLQRLNATVESLEASSASHKRQIDALASELQRVREETGREIAGLGARSSQRPWADDIKRHNEDLKRLADAITEVDRKRAADHEQVLKILGDLRKSVTALAEAPPPARNTPTPRNADRPARSEKPDKGGKSDKSDTTEKQEATDGAREPATPVKAIPYTVGKGESLSLIVDSFNADARKKGYKTLSVQEVMRFNKITDARKLAVGATLNLPLYPAPPKP